MNVRQALEMRRLESKTEELFYQFSKACLQCDLLQQEINNIRVRCERARQNGHAHFLYQQQMRRLTLQGVFRMYRHFDERKAECMIKLARIIVTNLPGADEHNSPFLANDVMEIDADEEEMARIVTNLPGSAFRDEQIEGQSSASLISVEDVNESDADEEAMEFLRRKHRKDVILQHNTDRKGIPPGPRGIPFLSMEHRKDVIL